MNCIFDSRWCGSHGIGRFSNELRARLLIDRELSHGKPMSPFDPFFLNFQLKDTPPGSWLFSPGYNAPFFPTLPYVLTIHDVNHIDRGENSSISKKIYYKTILKRICHNAQAILSVSEFSRSRLIDVFDLDPRKVFCVGNGVSDDFKIEGHRPKDISDYILCVSNRRGHKNEVGLLHALAKIVKDLPDERTLVFTGHPTDDLLVEIKSLGLRNRVTFTGRVSDADLAALYRGARYLVFPSFYEGFGLPIIEAFSCGTPVITSNITSMPEIAGDCALLVDPNDIIDIAEKIKLLEFSERIRNDLSLKGLERAKYFSWDRVVDNVVNAVNSVGLNLQRGY